MCNVIDGESGWKADLIVRKDRTFSASARQLENAKTLCALAGDTLDVAYIAEWATTLHVESLWRALRDAPEAQVTPARCGTRPPTRAAPRCTESHSRRAR